MNAPQRLANLQRLSGEIALEGLLTRTAEGQILLLLENDVSDIVRHEAAFILGDLARNSHLRDPYAAVKALKTATKDESILVQHEAALALANFDPSEVLECLIALSRSDIREVRDSAAFAIVDLLNRK